MNAQIDFYLQAGRKYYLKFSLYDMGIEEFEVYVNMQKPIYYHTTTGLSQVEYYFVEHSSNYVRFIPDESRIYNFETFLSDGDPYLAIYDENMAFLTADDDSGDGNDAFISILLEANKTYYIKIRNYGSTAGEGKLKCF